MAYVFSTKSYDMRDYNFFRLAMSSRLAPKIDQAFTVGDITYDDRIDAVYRNGKGAFIIGGTDLDFINSTPDDAGDVVGTVTGLFHSTSTNASGIWAGIQDISFHPEEFGAASETRSTVDDFALLRSALAGADTFELSNQADVAMGFAGNDFMRGHGGNDILRGGEGDDTLHGDIGNDKLLGEAGVDLLLGGAGHDRLEGGDGDDVLSGDAGKDTLVAGSGRDTLDGGAGRDVLIGGTDDLGDVFRFTSHLDSVGGRNRDVIRNFSADVDLIELIMIDANMATGDFNDTFAFSDRTAASHSVWWKAVDGGVLIRADVTGDTKADFEVFVAGVKSLAADDFLL